MKIDKSGFFRHFIVEKKKNSSKTLIFRTLTKKLHFCYSIYNIANLNEFDKIPGNNC